ncbi:MAG: riboflavin synthase subunit alpha [Candidatus Thermoplasmatota archaeon]|nr:riboflavin synthase subunit alpha [Candidatus Thermoplasmatota archaeon]
MFSGIVEGTGIITDIEERSEHIHWKVQLPKGSAEGLEIGASVSLDGVCLTVTNIEDEVIGFDIIQETLQRTTLNERSIGDLVNIERALRYGEEVGGHLVSGHIMATGTILDITYPIEQNGEYADETADIRIGIPNSLIDYIFEKGYIAIDGISLTIGNVDESSGFYLHIIPETLRRTTLGTKSVGDSVNIEIDSMTQAVVDTVKRVMIRERE